MIASRNALAYLKSYDCCLSELHLENSGLWGSTILDEIKNYADSLEE